MLQITMLCIAYAVRSNNTDEILTLNGHQDHAKSSKQFLSMYIKSIQIKEIMHRMGQPFAHIKE